MRQCQPTKQWSGNDTFCEGIFEIILLLLIENELKLTEELQRKKFQKMKPYHKGLGRARTHAIEIFVAFFWI